MDLDQLRTFLAVLEHGSFSRGAAALRIGQSTVSFHIKALETAVGAKLLDRRASGVKLTGPGKVLRQYALRIVALRDEALARLRAEDAGEAGHITIAASTIPGEYLLPPVLAELRKKHPAVAVTVEVSSSKRAIAALFAEECDLALVGARVRDKRVVTTAFADDGVVLVGPSPNRFAPNDRLTPKELVHVPLVLREEGSGTRETIEALVAKAHEATDGEAERPPKSGMIQVGSTEAAKRCVAHGVGLTFISRRAVEDELAEGKLRLVAFPGTPVKRSFYIARLRTVTPSTVVRALIALLTKDRR